MVFHDDLLYRAASNWDLFNGILLGADSEFQIGLIIVQRDWWL